MASDPTPTGSTADALNFLAAFTAAGSWHLVAIQAAGGVEARTFHAAEREQAHASIEARQGFSNAGRCGGDHCHNADRIMRLPGALNIPNVRKRKKGRQIALSYIVKEMTDFGRVFSPGDFGGGGASSVGKSKPSTKADLQPVDLESLPIAEFTKTLVRSGDYPDRPLGGANAAYQSRSVPCPTSSRIRAETDVRAQLTATRCRRCSEAVSAFPTMSSTTGKLSGVTRFRSWWAT